MSDFIGKRSDKGVVYPRLTIHGTAVDRVTGTTIDLDDTHFVVIGAGERLDTAKIKEIKKAVAKSMKSKKGSENASDSPVDNA
jgi:hypothetical protein